MRSGFWAGMVASAVAGATMLLLRLTLGSLTLPEALLDWVTLLVPLGLFSAAVEVFGVWAKRLLLAALVAGLMAAGGGIGLLWQRWLGRRPQSGYGQRWWLGLVLGLWLWLWLLAMALVLPASGRGLFGMSLRPWPIAMALAWLASSLAYATVLAGLYPRPETRGRLPEAAADASRRLLVKRLASAVVGLAVAAGVGAGVWKLASGLGRAVSSLVLGRLPPEVTHNLDFYTVSKNFVDPRVEVASWRLEVTGLVERRLTLDYEALKALPAVTQHLTLECISNPVGGELIGNALWKGVRLRELLSRAGVKGSARKVVLYGADDYTDSIALAKALEVGTVLAYEMNGVPVPTEHGSPARLLVPGIYGMKNVKWLTRIELVDYDYKGYWQERGWSDEAVIKTMSRIDVPPYPGPYRLGELEPIGGLTIPWVDEERRLEMEPEVAGRAWLGGIAFAGDRGISRVEVSTDGGRSWSQAQVKEALSPYTWVLWVYNWRPPGEGVYTVEVRAADGRGDLQSEEGSSTLPDGASGYHSVVVRLVAA